MRSIIVAGYLLLCILLGGSAQGVWTNLALQLLGIALIAGAAIASEPPDQETDSSTIVYMLLGLGGLVILLQLIPMPQSLWAELPGRSGLVSALALIGDTRPALPLSETPYRSVTTLFALIPGLALFAAVKMVRPSPRWLAVAIAAGMFCSIALGAFQVVSERDSWAYLYEITNRGAVGVFANRNHMGTLLIVSIPFATALLVATEGDRGGSAQARWVIGVAALILVIVGLVLNGSLAAISLAVPVFIASAAMVPAAVRWRGIALPVAGVALIGGVALLASAPIATVITEAGAETSVQSRQAIWSTTSSAIRDTFPAGTGLGSFEQVYRQYDDPSDVTLTYVNHAHNDYLQLVLELGAPGLALIVLFLGWWAAAAIKVWTSALSTPFGRAGTIASAAILAHSVIDFPLRTAAIAAIFGVAIAMMAQRLRSAQAEIAGERRPPRHVKLG
ncbi:MAG: O-antigen ligase family protein [Sphingomicrobium sp.]